MLDSGDKSPYAWALPANAAPQPYPITRSTEHLIHYGGLSLSLSASVTPSVCLLLSFPVATVVKNLWYISAF